MRSLPAVVVVLALAITGPAGCGGPPPREPLADGVTVVLDQGRMQRQDRGAFVRIGNDTDDELVVSALTLTSSRADAVSWTGTETVGGGSEADVDLTLPVGRCDRTTRFDVVLTYRLGDDDAVRSTVPVDDRYGAVTRVLDADCARSTLEDAVRLEVGRPVEDGRDLRVPVTLTPRADGPTVRLVGYRPTPLVRPTDASATEVTVGGTPDRAPVRADLVLAPARCDPHAIAEDKVGRLVPLEVSAPGVPEGTTFPLPLDHVQRVAVLDYVRSACGLD